MPDYTYLKSKVKAEEDAKASNARSQHEDFVAIFEQRRGRIVSTLIKACRETVEHKVTEFYKIGKKEYFKVSPFGGYRSIKKTGLFQTNYTLATGVCTAHEWRGKTEHVPICAEISATKPKDSSILVSRYSDGDLFGYKIFFPSEQHLNSVIHTVNATLAKEEIELYATNGGFSIRANLGAL